MARTPLGRYAGTSGLWWGVGLVVVGMVAMGLGWRGAAATVFVPTQVAFAVSGWLGGLLLVVLGLGIVRSRVERILEAEVSLRHEWALDAVDALNAHRRDARAR